MYSDEKMALADKLISKVEECVKDTIICELNDVHRIIGYLEGLCDSYRLATGREEE